MRVAVIGAGNVGVTVAYELTADGHEVTVFEQRGSVAAEASFAHGGLVAPGHLLPWAAPGVPMHSFVKWLRRDASVSISPQMNAATLHWLWHGWRACSPRRFQAGAARMNHLARYSRDRLQLLTHTLKLDYERADGCLVLLRDAQDATRATPRLAAWQALGVRATLLNATQCRAIEPGLNTDTALHAGIHLPQAEVGNARQFALLLRNEAQRLGARFLMHTTVQHLEPGPRPRVTHVSVDAPESTLAAPSANSKLHEDESDPVTESFDAVVLCTGASSAALLARHGLKLPMIPVHGWSLTAPLRHREAHPDHGPRAGLIDERLGVTVSRLGNRVRVSGGQRLGGSAARNGDLPRALYRALDDWFPGTAHLSQAQRWTGARPTLPDGLPLIGASGLGGVWLNLGHGSGGWALSTGSARLLADLIGRRPTAIEAEGLGLDRWQK